MQVFTLFSSVFVRFDEKAAVFYNTRTFVPETVEMTPELLDVCQKLCDIDNLNTISVDENNGKLCKRLCDNGFGVMHDEKDLVVSFPPSLVLTKDWARIRAVGKETTTPVLEYLTDITLYLGGKADLKEKICYQTEYPYPGTEHIAFPQLSDFLDRVSKLPEVRIRFVFPFIAGYPDIMEILNKIRSLNNRYNIIVCAEDYYGSNEAREILRNEEQNTIVVNDTRRPLFDNMSGSVVNRFLVFGELGRAMAEECIERLGLRYYSLIAVYNGSNGHFIEETAYPTEQELLAGRYTRRHIFSHQAINTFYFGHLSVSPDGKVYSDLREAPVGAIGDPFHTLIVAELNHNYAWRRTRYDKPGCKRCRLVDFCPSPGPLENSMETQCIITK